MNTTKNRMADPDLTLRDQYGDIHRLDAFPWINDLDARSESVMEQRDTFDTVEGRVRRYWRVTGNDELGLPLPSECHIYLALLVMTAEAGWQSEDIDFTFRTLAQRTGMQPGPEADKKIGAALDRLKFLRVHFDGTTVLPRGNQKGITVLFSVISSLYKVESEGEVDCTVSWNERVYRALRSSVREHQATTPEMPSEQFMSHFLSPVALEKTRPAQSLPPSE